MKPSPHENLTRNENKQRAKKYRNTRKRRRMRMLSRRKKW